MEKLKLTEKKRKKAADRSLKKFKLTKEQKKNLKLGKNKIC